MKLLKVLSRKPRTIKTRKTDVSLPAVKSVHLEFDKNFIHKCLKRRRATDMQRLNWPEALKTILKDCEKSENQLSHIISCCEVAKDNIQIYRKDVEKILLKHTNKDYL